VRGGELPRIELEYNEETDNSECRAREVGGRLCHSRTESVGKKRETSGMKGIA